MISRMTILFVCISLLCFCNSKSTVTSYDEDVQKIIIANIKATIGTGDSAKMAYRYPPPTADNPRYKRYYDSIYAILDTISAFISVTDSFAKTQRSDIPDIVSVQKDYKPGTEEYRLLDQLVSDSLSKNPVNLEMIATNIQLSVKVTRRENIDDIRLIARFGFSNIVLNRGRTKAVVYQSFYCGGKCGYGEVRFLEKKNNEWEVVKSDRTWIS